MKSKEDGEMDSYVSIENSKVQRLLKIKEKKKKKK
jgi:hypothetical protein